MYVQPFCLGRSPADVAGKSFLSFSFFVVFSNVFLSVTSNFSYLFNSSSTFKYIVGLSLQSEIPHCILCTVLGKLGSLYAKSVGLRRASNRWLCSSRGICKWWVFMVGCQNPSFQWCFMGSKRVEDDLNTFKGLSLTASVLPEHRLQGCSPLSK